MMDYIEMWYQELTTRASATVRKRSEAWGECNKHMGPSYWYAKVRIAIEPGKKLEIIDQLDKDKSKWLKHNDWYNHIIFGVLDVMMTYLTFPIRSFRLIILDADISKVGSRAIAFRLAARDATIKILSDYLPRT